MRATIHGTPVWLRMLCMLLLQWKLEAEAWATTRHGAKMYQGARRRMAATESNRDDNSSSSSNEYAYLQRIREGLRTFDAAWEAEWDASLELLVALSDTPSSARSALEAALATAWNWKRWAIVTSPLARKFIRTIPPDRGSIAAAIAWLASAPLSLDHATILQGILEAPEAYLLNPQENYEQALRVAPVEYQDPAAWRALVCRQPGALRCTYNCAATGCSSECGNCWVSFEYQMAAPPPRAAGDRF